VTPIVLTLVVALAAPGTAAADGSASALVLEQGAVSRHQIVAVGKDLVVAGEALAGVTALEGSARISGTVAGDVTVMGGDVTLEPTARVGGSVHVLGGHLRLEPGALVEGSSVAYPSFSRAGLTLLEGPSLGMAATSPVVLAAKLGLVAAWLAITLILFVTTGRSLVAASDEIRREPLLCFASGLVAVLALVLTGLLLDALLPSPLSLPLLSIVVVTGIVAKLWGSVAVFHLVGRLVLRALVHGRRPLLHEALLGVLLLGALKFVPVAGIAIWTAMTLVGVGAALRTRFGRLEGWVDSPRAMVPRSS